MKPLSTQQRLFVTHSAQMEVGKDVLHLTEAKITADQWPACDPIIADVIKRAYAAGGVTLIVKQSQRTRAGWSKLTFDGENELEVRRATKALERTRVRIERNNGYVVEAAKADPVALLAKRIERLDTRAQARLRRALGW